MSNITSKSKRESKDGSNKVIIDLSWLVVDDLPSQMWHLTKLYSCHKTKAEATAHINWVLRKMYPNRKFKVEYCTPITLTKCEILGDTEQ